MMLYIAETLFWSLLYRMLTLIKVVLATCDAGSGGKKLKPKNFINKV